jgi:hypothetical protein
MVRIRKEQSDPDPDSYQIERQDPNPYQSEKQDPDLYQKGLDPQHWAPLLTRRHYSIYKVLWFRRGHCQKRTTMNEALLLTE